MKMNRGQLLVMAFEGKVKKGDQFKSNTGDIIIFDGHAFVWEDGGQMLRNRVFGNETFTPHTRYYQKCVTLIKHSEVLNNDKVKSWGIISKSNQR
ncbi:hypothetical protein [Bacillus wiedmannii]|uniref:hypothetical protein n=1 Tax=Bacillus wiedmannii TaxID=1890302 RepID=UPI000BF0B934|nr:hypothetical protein [Bacillus wiedmannii]PEJ48378.1 hypothetical protein CN672_13620 [Bacillus wiedmannii]PEM10336.1 hypothetical protein CN610_14210 [Bacillus wiedmannii]PGD08284.1 hypothetical protein COM34_14380 [Bacillus wiedmannii]PHD09552.1 hypothetical protein COF45_17815 [Bacillus wiedmannii]